MASLVHSAALAEDVLLPVSVPVSGAFEPVEDVGAAGVVDLVKWMSVGLLHSHCIARGTEKNNHNLTGGLETADEKTCFV